MLSTPGSKGGKHVLVNKHAPPARPPALTPLSQAADDQQIRTPRPPRSPCPQVPSAAERKSGQDWSRALLLSCAFFGCFVAHDFLQARLRNLPASLTASIPDRTVRQQGA